MLPVTELVKMLDCTKELAVCGAAISKKDYAHVIELLKKYELFIDTFKHISDALPEGKDVDAAEGALLLGKIFEIVKAVKEELAK